ncbi:hypothetical protein D9V34_07600 [Mycetocola lacteus]|uniref:Cupin n=1 Tax=Mycetocola lacteus TaxID=76637 RepID=A0A3L7ASJ3_9MICO|nr:hypothetical protein [Mycetocola lacteus]RLP83094.1 hypothetical protein D9V34_07600 [Mycetocola lacteus]
MMTIAPEILSEPVLTITAAIERYAPTQGGIEFQTDIAGKVHDWHSHSVSERIVVLTGALSVSWVHGENGRIGEAEALTGDRVELPAHLIHRSVAGADGCAYLICPEGGVAAATTPHIVDHR